jgi:PKD repeat protein
MLFIIAFLTSSVNASEPRPCSVDEDSSVGEKVEYKPCPKFTYSPSSPTVEDAVRFDATSSYQPADGYIDEYHWFLDEHGGVDEYGTSADISFDEPGSHTVGLTVVNNRGERTYREKTIEVENTPPTAEFSYSPEPMIGRDIEFDASDSTDLEGEIKRYTWKMENRTTATGVRTTHRYEEYGEYEVELVVSDGNQTDRTTQTLIVDNVPPIPEIQFEQIPDEHTIEDEITVDASGSNDPDGGIEEYSWDFGDGTVKEGSVANHSYSTPGVYNLTLSISDGMDNSRETEEVRIINRPPVANVTYSPRSELTTGEKITFDASDSFDPDNNIDEVRWEFGSGEMAQGKVVEYSYEELGTYDVVVTVDDGTEKDRETVTVTVGPGEESADGFGFVVTLVSLLAVSVLIGRHRGQVDT